MMTPDIFPDFLHPVQHHKDAENIQYSGKNVQIHIMPQEEHCYCKCNSQQRNLYIKRSVRLAVVLKLPAQYKQEHKIDHD